MMSNLSLTLTIPTAPKTTCTVLVVRVVHLVLELPTLSSLPTMLSKPRIWLEFSLKPIKWLIPNCSNYHDRVVDLVEGEAEVKQLKFRFRVFVKGYNYFFYLHLEGRRWGGGGGGYGGYGGRGGGFGANGGAQQSNSKFSSSTSYYSGQHAAPPPSSYYGGMAAAAPAAAGGGGGSSFMNGASTGYRL